MSNPEQPSTEGYISSECPTPEQIRTWLEQGPGNESDPLGQHIAHCPRCQEELEDWRGFDELAEAYFHRQAGPPQIPGYRLIRPLGQGGFGSVWLAEDEEQQRLRALKFLHPERFNAAGIEALRDEGNRIDDLGSHPYRVRIYRFLTTDEQAVLVMEYLEGGNLAEQIAQGPLAWERACHYLSHIAEALVKVHAAGLLHGDIKPSNILVRTPQGNEAVLTDFGLARRGLDAGRGGTPGYAAPETLDNQVSPAADVFSLAATLYCLITGQPPITAQTLRESCLRAALGVEELTYPPEIPDEVRALIAQGLAPIAEDRPGLEWFHRHLRLLVGRRLGDRVQAVARQLSSPVPLAVTASVLDPTTRMPRTQVTAGQGAPNLNPVEWVEGRTGDRLVLTTQAGSTGYFALLVLGASGDLNVVSLPTRSPRQAVAGGVPVQIEAGLQPPSGQERLVVVWSSEPLDLDNNGWRDWIVSTAHALTARAEQERDIEIQSCLVGEVVGDRAVVLIGVRHTTGGGTTP